MAVVIITGSNSGFGLEGALAFARNGDTVYATMRDPSRADKLQKINHSENLGIKVTQLDVTETATFPEKIARIAEDAGRIDVLVNNAGVNQAGALEDFNDEDFRTVTAINYHGPMLLTKAVLPYMRAQNSGLIIMMSSLSGIAGLPGDVAYTGSKFALEGATEALRHEVDRWGIRVALVQAALYATSIFDKSLPPDAALPATYPAGSPYQGLVENRLGVIRQRMPEALDPKIIGDLFVKIATAEDPQLRWPADEVAVRVLETMFAQDDDERDAFLRGVAGTNWWSEGLDAPPDGGE